MNTGANDYYIYAPTSGVIHMDTSEIDTAITFTESEEGLEFELDNGRTLPCAVQLDLLHRRRRGGDPHRHCLHRAQEALLVLVSSLPLHIRPPAAQHFVQRAVLVL